MPMKLECKSLVCRMVKVFFPSAVAASSAGTMNAAPIATAPARNSRRESDCAGSQWWRRVVHRVHRRWDRGKYPAWGLVDAASTLIDGHAGVGHAGLQGVSCLTIALRMITSLRMQAVMASARCLPAARSRK